jgi:hypothetical protein
MLQDSVILHLLISGGFREDEKVRKFLIEHKVDENSERFKRIMELYKANQEAGNVNADKTINELLDDTIQSMEWKIVKTGTPIYVGFLLLNIAAYAAVLQVRQRTLGLDIRTKTIMNELVRPKRRRR